MKSFDELFGNFQIPGYQDDGSIVFSTVLLYSPTATLNSDLT